MLDDLSAGHAEAVRGVPLVRARVHDSATVRAALREHRIDAVMHFAAWLAVGESVRDPGKYYENNVTGSLLLLEAMAAEGVRQLVFSSTCAVYGEPDRLPLTETHRTAPVNAYGESKLVVERALGHFGAAHGLRAIALRYFNAAGADPDGVLGEDHDPEIHLIPLAIDAARGGPRPSGVRSRLPDARRHLPPRLRPRDGPRHGPCPGAGGARGGTPECGVQHRHGTARGRCAR